MSDLERAKKYLDMIPDELRGSPNDLVQLLSAMVAGVESQQATITELTEDNNRLALMIVKNHWAELEKEETVIVRGVPTPITEFDKQEKNND